MFVQATLDRETVQIPDDNQVLNMFTKHPLAMALAYALSRLNQSLGHMAYNSEPHLVSYLDLYLTLGLLTVQWVLSGSHSSLVAMEFGVFCSSLYFLPMLFCVAPEII